MASRFLAVLAAFALATVAFRLAADDGIKAVGPAELTVRLGRSKLLRSAADIRRTSVADAAIAEVLQVARAN